VGHAPAGDFFVTTPHAKTGMETASDVDIQKISICIVFPTDVTAMV
jgi:hypothetical protein